VFLRWSIAAVARCLSLIYIYILYARAYYLYTTVLIVHSKYYIYIVKINNGGTDKNGCRTESVVGGHRRRGRSARVVTYFVRRGE